MEEPLDGNKITNIFKLYMRDSDLFVAVPERGTVGKILSYNMGIYKVAIYEYMNADACSKMDRKLYYFHKNSGLEIDFITKFEDEISLVEVKTKGRKTKSASTILNDKAKYHING